MGDQEHERHRRPRPDEQERFSENPQPGGERAEEGVAADDAERAPSTGED